MGCPIKQDSLVSRLWQCRILTKTWITVSKKCVTQKLKLACWNGS